MTFYLIAIETIEDWYLTVYNHPEMAVDDIDETYLEPEAKALIIDNLDVLTKEPEPLYEDVEAYADEIMLVDEIAAEVAIPERVKIVTVTIPNPEEILNAD